MNDLVVVGGGLAGCEAAWQAAERGVKVRLFEMRPVVQTGAHLTDYLGELVCSNSLGSNLADRASGLLKNELRAMGSLLLSIADDLSVPAGRALAVDRTGFAARATERAQSHPNIQVVREEVTSIPETTAIIASGPLTSTKLSQAIAELSGEEHLYFFDAIAPIVNSESIDRKIAFQDARYAREKGESGDYLNCPLSREEYETFVDALLSAERIELKSFEQEVENGIRAGVHAFFEGCLPVEILAQRAREALAFGPMRPVGLIDPRSGKRPFAVVQLRQDNQAGTMYNLVGFQTNLKFTEQRRVFQLIPGLERAEFLRYGQMHRNTFIFSPKLLRPTLQFYNRDDLFFAGQITGVEGYVGNIGTGLLAGWNAARLLNGEPPLELPKSTMLGALCHYVTHAAAEDFQPMKANFGILPPLKAGMRRNKRERAAAYAQRAIQDLKAYLRQVSRDMAGEAI